MTKKLIPVMFSGIISMSSISAFAQGEDPKKCPDVIDTTSLIGDYRCYAGDSVRLTLVGLPVQTLTCRGWKGWERTKKTPLSDQARYLNSNRFQVGVYPFNKSVYCSPVPIVAEGEIKRN